jgi:hypothetical protein
VVKDARMEEQNVIPGKLAETTPPYYPAYDYTAFTFQAIMEIQKSIGQLTQAVTALTEESKKRGETLDHISHKVYAAQVILVIIGVILTSLGGVVTFFISKFWNVIIPLLQIKSHP